MINPFHYFGKGFLFFESAQFQKNINYKEKAENVK